MVGMFSAQDFIVFYMFFEGVLIPMFLIIGVWGGPRRVYASFKFFLYTLLGSILMLLALLAVWFAAGTTDIAVLMHTQFPARMQFWLFLAFLASFAVKVPMWPVHTWLPDAHVEAPTAGSVILAGVLLKMGAYGFLRFSLPMLPQACAALRAADVRARRDRGDLHLAGRAGADRHEEADRLFVGRAYGRRRDRHLHLQRAGYPGRDVPDAVARHRLGGAVPLRRRGLRPDPHARHRPLWRPGPAHAGLCGGVHAVHHGEHRPAGHGRLRRRVPGAGRRVQGQFLAGAAGQHGDDPGRGLHAVSVSPGHLRRDHAGRSARASSTCRRARSPCSRRSCC